MILVYPGKRTEQEILARAEKAVLCPRSPSASPNKLILGENLAVLRCLLEDYHLAGRVDLVYIDPPFSTNVEYRIGSDRANTVSMAHDDEVAYSDTLVGAEYLEFLRERLIFLRELMSDRASIYLHIDYKIGHYVKIIMDEVFGRENFRNDIARIKCNPKNFRRQAYGNIKDLILFYSKTDSPTWNEPRMPLLAEDVERLFKKVDKSGRRYTTVPLHAPGETQNGKTGQPWRGLMPPKGRHWRSPPEVLEELDRQGLIEWSATGVPRKKIFADEQVGKKAQDVWEFKDPQYPCYPTEKNLDLLKFIIGASSNPGDLVLDCFCGSGTTLVAAQQLGRRWIGVDQSEHAIAVAERRLRALQGDLFTGAVEFEVLFQENVTVPTNRLRSR
ncbi:MAG: site-specific DNA-methyltransferase [Anaerolineae bacterium]|nr:site-specific DNA-methyltransferase [Anaerolineae bacterium]